MTVTTPKVIKRVSKKLRTMANGTGNRCSASTSIGADPKIPASSNLRFAHFHGAKSAFAVWWNNTSPINHSANAAIHPKMLNQITATLTLLLLQCYCESQSNCAILAARLIHGFLAAIPIAVVVLVI